MEILVLNTAMFKGEGVPSELSLRNNFYMTVHLKETTKGKQANLYITEIIFSSAFQKSTFQRHRMKLKKIWLLEDNILILRQALVKMYLLLYLLMVMNWFGYVDL